MVKKNIVLFALLAMPAITFAQQLKLEKGFWGNKIMDNDKAISVKELVNLTSSNSIANNFALKAKTNKGFSDVFGGVGGFLMGWSIGTKIGGGEWSKDLFFTGIGVVCVGIPFSLGMTKNSEKAIDTFNGKAVVSDLDYSIIANANGIGLSIGF